MSTPFKLLQGKVALMNACELLDKAGAVAVGCVLHSVATSPESLLAPDHQSVQHFLLCFQQHLAISNKPADGTGGLTRTGTNVILLCADIQPSGFDDPHWMLWPEESSWDL